MILVTLGTNDKVFTRLLDAVEKCIADGVIKDRVVVQAGYTAYTSTDMEIFDYLDTDQFAQLISEADLIITHGGAGSIMTGLREDKKVLGCARLARYGEHVNDHQVQLLEAFDKLGCILYVRDLDQLGEYIKRAETFVPAPYTSNTNNMIRLLNDWIAENVSEK